MEASPLSVHSLSLPHHRPLSTKLAVVSRQKFLISLNPNPHPHLTSSTYYNSTSSSLFKIPINTIPSFQSRKNRSLLVTAAFEKFTERAIKSVVFSQREAKSLGKDMVFPQHLLLGLIAESGGDSDGFLGSGITIETARDAVRSIWKVGEGDDNDRNNLVTSASDLPFSISTKRVFEAAVEYSWTMGYNFIAPEHIALGLFTVDDGSAGCVLKRTLAVVQLD